METIMSQHYRPNQNIYEVIFTFLFNGLFIGFLFGYLTTIPKLRYFWFTQSDKFLEETFKYCLCLSFFLFIGLTASYVIAHAQGWLTDFNNRSTIRSLLAASIVILTAPILNIFGNLVTGIVDPVLAKFVLTPLAFLTLISVAVWVISLEWYIPGFLLMIFSLLLTLALTYLLSHLLRLTNDWINIIYFSIGYSLLCASCGYWLIKINNKRVK